MSQAGELTPHQRETIEILLRCGVPSATIQKQMEVSPDVVEKVSLTTQTFSTILNPKDAELADQLRELANQAIRNSAWTLRYGSPVDKAVLTRAIVSRSMALIGAEQTSRMDTVRDEFDVMMGRIRNTDEDDDDDIIDVG